MYLRLLLIFVAALCIAALNLQPSTQPGNDAVQYLLGARELQLGQGYLTPVLFFDEHYAAGTLPAPQTVWPPGYSFLLSAVAGAGLDLPSAAILISLVSFGLIAALVFLLTLKLTGSAAAAWLATLWQLSIAEYWSYAAAINSDLPFTAVCLLLLIVWRPAPSLPQMALISLLAGVAFALRYAGFFPLLLVGGFALIRASTQLRRGGPQAALVQLAAAAPGFVIFALLLLRNWLFTGGMQGGNNKAVVQPLTTLLLTTVKSLLDLLFGLTSLEFKGGGSIALLAGSVLIVLAAAAFITFSAVARRRPRLHLVHGAGLFAAAFVVLYIAGIIWVARGTMLTFDSRYFLPVVPVIISLAAAIAWGAGVRPRAACTAAVLIVIALQLTVYPRRAAGHSRFVVPDDREAVAWLAEHTAPDETVMVIGNGQRLGYYSHRSTLAIPERQFTSIEWDEQRLRETIARYGVRAVIVGRKLAAEDYPLFALGLAAGEPSASLSLAARTNASLIYTVRPSSER